MSNKFQLDIISHHSKFNNKIFKKFHLEGVDTIGVWGDENFEIRFKNNTWQKVQVRLSIDGTDILTGETATTDATGKMWSVEPYGTLSLTAWPESNEGGASFIFTNAANSVAVHTHADLSSRGIIAAAVFTEGHVEPLTTKTIEHHHHHYDRYPIYPYYYPTYPLYPFWYGTSGVDITCDQPYTTSVDIYCGQASGSLQSTDWTSYNVSCSANNANTSFSVNTKSLESLAAVGAGEYVEQHIANVAGLIKPILSDTIRVRFLWWDELVEKLRVENYAQPQPSGFPGDDNKKNIDLKNTPRKQSLRQRVSQSVQVFERF